MDARSRPLFSNIPTVRSCSSPVDDQGALIEDRPTTVSSADPGPRFIPPLENHCVNCGCRRRFVSLSTSVQTASPARTIIRMRSMCMTPSLGNLRSNRGVLDMPSIHMNSRQRRTRRHKSGIKACEHRVIASQSMRDLCSTYIEGDKAISNSYALQI
jgi:hypothetical protein